MKQTKKLGLSALFFAASVFLLAAPAQAANYVGSCAGFLGGAYDDVLIDDTSGNCNIGFDITAKHAVSINATGPITAKNITLNTASNTYGTGLYGEYGNIYVNGPSTVELGNLKTTANVISGGGHIVVNAGSTLKAGTITAVYGSFIDLEVQKNGGNVPLVIGTTGTNGVGKVSTSGNNLTSQNPQFNYTTMTSTIVYIVNGNATSTGGIALSTGGLIAAQGGGSRGSGIILNAQKGQLDIPAGTINASVVGSNLGGGQIDLLANTINFAGSVTLNANATATNLPFNNQVNLSATAINYATLTMTANGMGVPPGSPVAPNGLPSSVNLFSEGQFVVTSTQNLDTSKRLVDLKILINPANNVPLGPLTLTGTGTLTATANGDTAQILVKAYPIKISGTIVSLTSTGKTDHFVVVTNGQSFSAGTPGLDISATGGLTLNASAIAGGNGGAVYINTATTSLTAVNKTIALKANGPPTGNGEGGNVYLNAHGSFLLDPDTKMTMEADAATVGSGDAKFANLLPYVEQNRVFSAVELRFILGSFPDPFTLGVAPGEVSISATSGKTGGDGGTILVHQRVGTSIDNALAVDASALGTTGNGGEIRIENETGDPSGVLTFPSGVPAKIAVKATGGTVSGLGGKVRIDNLSGGGTAPNPHIDVNDQIKVDGGSALTPSDFGGSIGLNGIICKQIPIAATWPKTYWICDDAASPPNSPTPREAAIVPAVQSLPQIVKTKVGSTAVNGQLYLYKNFQQYKQFTADPVTDVGPEGYSWVPYSMSNAFESGNGFDFSQSLPGAIIHEVGHLYADNTTPNPTAAAAFQQAVSDTAWMMSTSGPYAATCLDVFGPTGATYCTGTTPTPWDVWVARVVGGVQLVYPELFAEAFQACSGYPMATDLQNHAEQSAYFAFMRTNQKTTIWASLGCQAWKPKTP